MGGRSLLQQIAQILKSHVRSKDLVAHMGGDEFLILLDGLNDEHKIVSIAQRILKDCQQPFKVGDYELLTGVSMGIVLGQTIYKNPADLIRHAELALSNAKQSGANQYKLFDLPLHQEMIKRNTLEKDLRKAIAQEQFILHYQPIVALRGGDLIGFEVLARWIHPDKGVIPPSEFIPIAEDMGLLVALDRFVIRKACEQMHAWQLQFRNCSDLKLSINLAAQTLVSPQLCGILNASFLRWACPINPSYLILRSAIPLLNFRGSRKY
ncbi:MAG: EAL domain-containing protein [Acaryochloridaceae cyanobacterium RL_2_7]|nr:EAL domain-containing protein [Acaryochloridaceae cyanobacterium RL_2_7]